ncbi:MAG: response regulator transcription factor [Verrucomicrobiales bacterium]|jgi:DNA-binding response OmpR family regulator|nr:response regulator transcription factor [Verrucomicrobiales bacterium]
MPTILVIEDDSAIRRGVADALTFGGYEVIEGADGKTGERLALQARFDLLLLDLVLPGASGFDILQALKRDRPGIPIIILSARGEEADRVNGLKFGADDYVVKPFSMKELLARVEAVLRRSPERPPAVSAVAFPGGVANLERREALFDDGDRVELSDREASLIAYLARYEGRAISREEILRRVWKIDSPHIETRTIDMHVANLRSKLRDSGETPKILLTLRGKGYMLTTEGG